MSDVKDVELTEVYEVKRGETLLEATEAKREMETSCSTAHFPAPYPAKSRNWSDDNAPSSASAHSAAAGRPSRAH